MLISCNVGYGIAFTLRYAYSRKNFTNICEFLLMLIHLEKCFYCFGFTVITIAMGKIFIVQITTATRRSIHKCIHIKPLSMQKVL